jgi:SAM-dependent methyltransferase
MAIATLRSGRYQSNGIAVQRLLHAIPGSVAVDANADRASGQAVHLTHGFGLESISDAAMVAELLKLVECGALSGQADFEAAALGLVLTCADDPALCWQAFYDNSLEELTTGRSPFASVHHRALSQLAGSSVLEVGSCFGFFALRAAHAGFDVQACDISRGAVELLNTAAERLGLPVQARVGDALALPYPDASVDTVTLIHLLEHLPSQVDLAIAEALRVARARVVIAVPYEDVPSPHFGHHYVITPRTLVTWARRADHAGAQIFEDNGGWLVLDVPPAP